MDSNCCRLLFSFLQFTANPDLICLFAHEIFTDPLSRSAQTTILNDDAKMNVQIDSFFSTQSLLQCPIFFFFKGDSHVLIRHLYAIALLRGLPIQGTSFLYIHAAWIQLG